MLTQHYDDYEYQDDYSQYPENLDYHNNDYGNPGLPADNFYDYLGQTNNQFPNSNTDSFYEDPFIVNQKRPPTQAPTRPPTRTTTKRSRWSKKKRKWTPFNNHLFGRKKRSAPRHKVVFICQCSKMQLISFKKFIIKTCFIQYLWFFR